MYKNIILFFLYADEVVFTNLEATFRALMSFILTTPELCNERQWWLHPDVTTQIECTYEAVKSERKHKDAQQMYEDFSKFLSWVSPLEVATSTIDLDAMDDGNDSLVSF